MNGGYRLNAGNDVYYVCGVYGVYHYDVHNVIAYSSFTLKVPCLISFSGNYTITVSTTVASTNIIANNKYY